MVMGRGFYWKFMLVTPPCQMQHFALAKAPQLGSSVRAAPARLVRDAV